MSKILTATLLTLLCCTSLTLADTWNTKRADSHAPIGVMGDHLHHPGELMTSYRYSEMTMDGNKTGNGTITTESILDDYMMAPTFMRMKMHMVGVMLAPTENVTVMFMAPFMIKEMTMKMRNGTYFDTKASGLGDVSVTTLVGFSKTATYNAHLNLGISLPTGKLEPTDDTPLNSNAELPYAMRLSSGTVDLKPGVTYFWQKEKFSYGSQLSGTIRLGKNTESYTLGNNVKLTSWIAKPLDQNMSVSLRGQVMSQGNVIGSDDDLNRNMMPTAAPSLQGGKRADIALGMNWFVPTGTIKGNRLAVELGFPVFHNLDGPQMATNFWYTIGWQLTF